jgi:hemerythrin-like metal-binding protein
VEDRSFQYAGALTVSIGGAEYAEHEEAAAWFERADRQLYLAKSGGRNRACVAAAPVPTGHAAQSWPPIRLQWHEAYESGAAELDAQHRAIFARANNLLAAMCNAEPDRDVVARAMDALVESVAAHFRYEEALLELHGYEKAHEHAAAHRRLLSQAAELKAALDRGQTSVGPVVAYLANDVVSGHLARDDRDFFPLLVRAGVRAA